MRNFFSYVLLISLLFPTVVEAFHVLHDSHDTFISEGVNINDSKLKCQISLFSNQEDETGFFSQDTYESFKYHITTDFKNPSEISDEIISLYNLHAQN